MTITFDQISPYLEELGPMCGAAVSVVVAYMLSVTSYRKQKENEAVRIRYLENTLDLFTSHVEHCLSIHRMNWMYGLGMVMRFRSSLPRGTTEEHLSRVQRLDHSHLDITTAYRLGTLLNGNIEFYRLHQLLVGLLDRGVILLEDGIIRMLGRVPDEHRNNNEIDIMCEELQGKLHKLNNEAESFYGMLTEILIIAHEFEKLDHTFKTVRDFHKNAVVVGAVTRVKALLRPHEEGIEHLKKSKS